MLMKTMKMIRFKFYLIVKVKPEYVLFHTRKKDQKQFHILLHIKDKVTTILFQIIKVHLMKITMNLKKVKRKIKILIKMKVLRKK